jgi:tetratricopeptide (TPR) repeat protein
MSLVQTENLLLFFSYARQDKGLRDKLEEHLSNLKYRGLISTWHIREIGAGEDWQQQVDIHLESAHIILLLISSSFMASQYCYSMEMTRAMERHQQGKARVIPVLLRPVLFTGAPFAMLKMLPTNGKPVVNWRNRDSAFVDIALGIERVVREEATKSTRAYPSGQPFGQFGQPVLPPSGIGYVPAYQQQIEAARKAEAEGPSGIGQVPAYQQPQLYSPPPAPQRRRSVVLQRFAFVSLSLLLLGIVVAGVLFSLFTLHPPACPSGPPCTGNPNLLFIALALLAVMLVAILIIIAWRRSIQARRRVKVIKEAEQQRQEEARRREQEEAEQQQEVLITGTMNETNPSEQEKVEQQQEEVRKREQEEDYYEQALQAYDRAPYLDPLARRGKGNALAALGRYDEALQSLYLSAILDPSAATYARMGDVYLALRRYSDAAAAYERAIALDPQFALAYASLGDALEQLGRTQDAEQAHEQARQLEALYGH